MEEKMTVDTNLDEGTWEPRYLDDEACIWIPENNLGKLDDRFGKINRKAAKLDCEPVSYKVVREEYRDDEETGLATKWLRVEVSGEPPVVEGGWKFQASLDHLYGSDAGNLVHTAPSCEDIPEKYKTTTAHCDHCKTNRRRKKTVLLVNEAGEWIQVGRSCLKDFFGLDPARAAFMASWIHQVEDAVREATFGGNGGRSWYISLDKFMAETAAVVRMYGWVSRTEASDWYARKVATADIVIERLESRKIADEDKATDADRKAATKAIEWAADLKDNGEPLNDYLYNLSVIAEAGWVGSKTIGLAASMFVAGQNAEKRARQAAKKAAWDAKKATFKHFGTEKKREEFTLKVTRIIDHEGEWGTTWIVGLEDTEGNPAVWFSSNRPRLKDKGIEYKKSEVLVGKTYLVRGTVKEHSSYQDAPQTVLTRCVFKTMTAQCHISWDKNN